jgi:hypothetical protein
MTKLTVLLLIGLVSLTGGLSAQEPDRKGLLGSWDGRWTGGASGDRMNLTINEAAGNTFAGTVYIHGSQSYHNRALPVSGRITGDPGSETLAFEVPAAMTVRLQRSGSSMTGVGQGPRSSAQIELTKAK